MSEGVDAVPGASNTGAGAAGEVATQGVTAAGLRGQADSKDPVRLGGEDVSSGGWPGAAPSAGLEAASVWGAMGGMKGRISTTQSMGMAGGA